MLDEKKELNENIELESIEIVEINEISNVEPEKISSISDIRSVVDEIKAAVEENKEFITSENHTDSPVEIIEPAEVIAEETRPEINVVEVKEQLELVEETVEEPAIVEELVAVVEEPAEVTEEPVAVAEEPVVVVEEPAAVKEEADTKLEEVNEISEEVNEISEEANEISEETNEISEEANEVSEETNEISEETNEVSEDSVPAELTFAALKEDPAGFIERFLADTTNIVILVMAVAAIIVTIVGIVIMSTYGKENDKPKAQPVVASVNPTTSASNIEQAPKLSLYLEAVADEDSITAKVYGEDGEVLTNHELVFNLLKGTKEENSDNIEKIKNSYAGEKIADLDMMSYPDEDKDGAVVMSSLEKGTYTLAVQAEKGYVTPNATEATIEAFELDENVMKNVVVDSAETQKEDPSKVRETVQEAPQEESEEAEPEGTKVTMKVIKMAGSEYVYTVSSSYSIELSDAELAKYKSGSVITEDSAKGTTTTYKGYVYKNGEVEITDGKKNVISEFIVANDTATNLKMNTTATTAFNKNVLKADASTVAPSVKETQKETEASADSTTKATETSALETTKDNETTEVQTTGATNATVDSTSNTTGTVASSTTSNKKKYTVLVVKPVVVEEVVYGDGWQQIAGVWYYFEKSVAATGWKKINGMQYYFKGDGALGSSLVIDVSQYNGTIDWKAVKAAGIDYAIIRVGYRGYQYAKLVKDKNFDANMAGATAAGIRVGAYVVTQAVNTAEAVEEASFIIQACSKYNVSLPLVIDVESAGNGTGRGDKISAAERTAVINAFAQTVKSSGYTPMLYANKNWMEYYINAGSVVGGCPVWLAQYNSTCTYKGSYSMWQFTDGGKISGISGSVDISAWKNL